MKERIVIALDVPSKERALELVELLAPQVGMFKIGSLLFTACGPQLVTEVLQLGGRVFLDLKFHDIPNTVAEAVAAAAQLGVDVCNVHALGGFEMMAAAAARLRSFEPSRRPKLLAVTVLTSQDQKSLAQIGISEPVHRLVVRLATLAAEAGLDGVVASAQEIQAIRGVVPRNFIILTPGIRPPGTAVNDQKRVMTPAEAFAAGADYIVLGRPVIEHPSPLQVLDEVLASISAS
ncbi:MAG: orotidine-5'-phosphate decarboxylase [Acidobacteriota bacterium]|nr:orotidine-5'-phosphate decarboxylase [Blastocatellia bacterium]MDW8411142.1 orotidine-5'-phosphate decarboxylase [Acidobacteriota bacterium]